MNGENMKRRKHERSGIEIAGRERSTSRIGFTLIELLVVIAVIALLIAILVPTLQRVRNHARAVVCQAHLRQWGTMCATLMAENEGHLPRLELDDPKVDTYRAYFGWFREYDTLIDRIRLCPSASKPASEAGAGSRGGTFLAWGRWVPRGTYGYDACGSYGCNAVALASLSNPHDNLGPGEKLFWRIHIRGRSNIPVYLDSALVNLLISDASVPPPESDAVPVLSDTTSEIYGPCINRHGGGVNAVFMDWSVRKVGLKELWTLKWHSDYNTANRWTLAGGVQPEDWPEWMRKFKDY